MTHTPKMLTLILLVLLAYVIKSPAKDTTYNFNEDISVRTYQSQDSIKYSIKSTLLKTDSTKTICVFSQEYDPINDCKINNSVGLKFIYYIKPKEY